MSAAGFYCGLAGRFMTGAFVGAVLGLVLRGL